MKNFQLSTFNFKLPKVILVDDHKVIVDGIERLINDSGFAVVTGKAYSVAGCWELLAKSVADVLLLDINLPDGNGLELFPQIKKKYPDLKIVILTSHTEYSFIKQACDNGISGYIMKNAAADVIIDGIRMVASGKSFFCDETKNLMKKSDKTTVILSRREQEMVRLIIAGKSGKEIANAMFLGYETVKSYRKRLMFKLNVTSAPELARVVMEQGLVLT